MSDAVFSQPVLCPAVPVVGADNGGWNPECFREPLHRTVDEHKASPLVFPAFFHAILRHAVTRSQPGLRGAGQDGKPLPAAQRRFTPADGTAARRRAPLCSS
jgi:hypothetical protein